MSACVHSVPLTTDVFSTLESIIDGQERMVSNGRNISSRWPVLFGNQCQTLKIKHRYFHRCKCLWNESSLPAGHFCGQEQKKSRWPTFFLTIILYVLYCQMHRVVFAIWCITKFFMKACVMMYCSLHLYRERSTRRGLWVLRIGWMYLKKLVQGSMHWV